MSPRNESEHTPHPQSLIETIDAKIVEGAEKTKFLFSSPCIYKVPEELRKLKESAYTPRLIAIGPLHRNDKHLKTPMQYVKGSYTNHLLLRLTEGEMDPELAKQKRSRVLEECVAEMKQLIDDAKKWYADEVELDVDMLLIDGCFIIELLYRKCHERDSGNSQAPTKSPNVQKCGKSSSEGKMADPFFGNSLIANTVPLDLLLIENQIPFFVLQKLFCLTIDKIPNRPDEITFNDLVHMYFSKMIKSLGFWQPDKSSTGTTSCLSSDCVLRISGKKVKYYHILHKLHEDCQFSCDKQKKTSVSELMPSASNVRELMPSASNLEYAGIKFVRSTGKEPFNVKFTKPPSLSKLWRRATFEIPTLCIYDSTETFLRNMIAFEQCCHGVSQHFTSYAYLMDTLVNSKEDVKSLENAEVVHNYLGASEDAMDLFNKLCEEVGVEEFFFANECDEATKYSKLFWPKNMAHLKRTYFASPWTFKAFLVGFIAFVISVIQFIEKYLK